jgi:gas vesicle structural protein
LKIRCEENGDMALERIPPEILMVELLDRVLDKGVVIDAAVRVSLVGIRLLEMEMQVVVASMQTYLDHAEGYGTALPGPLRRELPVSDRAVAGSVREVELEARGSAAASKQPPERPVEPR